MIENMTRAERLAVLDYEAPGFIDGVLGKLVASLALARRFDTSTVTILTIDRGNTGIETQAFGIFDNLARPFVYGLKVVPEGRHVTPDDLRKIADAAEAAQ